MDRQLHSHLKILTQEYSYTFTSKLFLPFPQKHLIQHITGILFLRGKVFIERGGRFQMAQSELFVDCCRITRGIQHKGFLKCLFQNSSPSYRKKVDFTTNSHFVSCLKKRERGTATACILSYKLPLFLVESAICHLFSNNGPMNSWQQWHN